MLCEQRRQKCKCSRVCACGKAAASSVGAFTTRHDLTLAQRLSWCCVHARHGLYARHGVHARHGGSTAETACVRSQTWAQQCDACLSTTSVQQAHKPGHDVQQSTAYRTQEPASKQQPASWAANMLSCGLHLQIMPAQGLLQFPPGFCSRLPSGVLLGS